VETAVGSPASLPEELRVHFLRCPACGEEARSLAAIVAGEHELSSDQAVARLDAAILGTDA
ncbi:MAG: hypothetical protein ACRDWW_01875, partial [Acidimicrobiales bacterium]